MSQQNVDKIKIIWKFWAVLGKLQLTVESDYLATVLPSMRAIEEMFNRCNIKNK